MRQLADDEVARFHTKSGLLTARRNGDAIEMDFPAESAESCSFPTDLARAIGISMSWVGMNRFDYLVELQKHAEEVKAAPHQWLPWSYGDTLAAHGETAATDSH